MSEHSSNSHNRGSAGFTAGGPMDDDQTHPLHGGHNASSYAGADEHAPDFDLNSMSQGSNYPTTAGSRPLAAAAVAADVQSEGIPDDLLAFNQRYAETDVASQGPGGASLQDRPASRRSGGTAPGGGGNVATVLATPGAPAGGNGYNPFQPGGGKAARRHQRQLQRQSLLNELRQTLEHKLLEKEQRQALRTIEYEERLEKHRQHRFPAAGTVALCSCGMTTTILNYPNTGYFEMATNVPAMQIMFCGVAQTIAGIFEWVNGVTFAQTAFMTYAAFHMSIGIMLLLPEDKLMADNKNSFYYAERIANPSGFAPTSDYFLGTYQLFMAIHSFGMWSCTPTMNIIICILLFNVFLTYLLQCIAKMIGNEPLLHAGGWSGIISGGFMVYLGVSETVNAVWDRTILPIFPFVMLRKKYHERKLRKAAKEADSVQV